MNLGINMLGNEDYDLNSYYVRYDYPNGEYNITELKCSSEQEVESKVSIYPWQEKYYWKFVTEDDYVNYFKEQVETWTVGKDKKKMYIKTKFSKYHSNVVGSEIKSNHPDFIKLSNGEKIDVSEEKRLEIMQSNQLPSSTGYWRIHSQIRFKILREWENDTNTSGYSIRWEIPKDAELIYE